MSNKPVAFTHHYEVEAERLWQAFEASLENLNQVKVVNVDAAGHSAELKTSMSLFSWGQELTASVRASVRGGSLLEVQGQPKSGFLASQWGEDETAKGLENKLTAAVESNLG